MALQDANTIEDEIDGLELENVEFTDAIKELRRLVPAFERKAAASNDWSKVYQMEDAISSKETKRSENRRHINELKARLRRLK